LTLRTPPKRGNISKAQSVDLESYSPSSAMLTMTIRSHWARIFTSVAYRNADGTCVLDKLFDDYNKLRAEDMFKHNI
jgi:hypothetical protein